MKKNISKIMMGACLSSALLLTGCIDEVIPTEVVTEDQVTSSNKAAEALMWAMPAGMNVVGTLDPDVSKHYDWGYGSVMHVRDVMTGDMPVISSGYNWYSAWEENKNMGESYIYGQFIWNYYWSAVLTTNKMLAAFTEEEATDVQKGYLAVAHAYRALYYLDMAQMYEFLPNDMTTGDKVQGLTVPIVRETTTEQDARNNPRVPRAEMAKFILEDLDKAEELVSFLDIKSRVLPQLDVIYGLKARYYLWLEDYANAKTYARKAIDNTSIQPMDEEACLNTTSGFNDPGKWMWAAQLVKENDQVKTGIINWTSWMSNETTFGYSGVEPYLMIDASMYDRISDTDFRKKIWKAPANTTLDGETKFLPGFEGIATYASTKFRPTAGNTDDVNIGAASAYPLMRVEEMYFIEAEAAAHLNEAEGRALVTEFMTNYRDASYATSAAGKDLVEEIVFQKRVELWGEGLAFYDIKRLNLSVTRGYPGTNYSDAVRFNTNGRPAWMNICIVQTEKNNNEALIGFENPDPSDKYVPWVEPKDE